MTLAQAEAIYILAQSSEANELIMMEQETMRNHEKGLTALCRAGSLDELRYHAGVIAGMRDFSLRKLFEDARKLVEEARKLN